jgi:hypothetical protein
VLGKGGMGVEGGLTGSFGVEAIGLEVLVDKFGYLSNLDIGVSDDSWMTTRIKYSREHLADTKLCDI